jgi:poly(hydroxyalkanoate) depolymerase family esterase
LKFLLLTACAPPPAESGFREVQDFGENPGNLRMFTFAPENMGEGTPLILSLHGCLQDHTAAEGTGLLARAEEHGFFVLAPQQVGTNNPQGCFRWYESGQTGRDQGEAASIAAMIQSVRAQQPLGPTYILGMSAGAAMTVAMLGSYPELFEAGMSAAGGPYGCAGTVLEAAACMTGPPEHSAEESRDRVPGDGPWPRLLVVHGSVDPVVAPANAPVLAQQWADLRGIENPISSEFSTPEAEIMVEQWGDRQVERLELGGVGHAWPVVPDAGCGEKGSFTTDSSFCSIDYTLEFFGLL